MSGYAAPNASKVFKATAGRGSQRNRVILQPRGGKNIRP